jgi:hypothetical protein
MSMAKVEPSGELYSERAEVKWSAFPDLFRAQVPEGIWRAGYVGHRLAHRFKGRAVFDVAFKLIAPVDVRHPPSELGNFFGKIVPRFVNKLSKRDKPSLQSTMARDYRICVELLPPRHIHLLNPREIYSGIEVEVEIVDIRVDSKGIAVPEGARYSKIENVLRRTAGRPPAWGPGP